MYSKGQYLWSLITPQCVLNPKQCVVSAVKEKEKKDIF